LLDAGRGGRDDRLGFVLRVARFRAARRRRKRERQKREDESSGSRKHDHTFTIRCQQSHGGLWPAGRMSLSRLWPSFPVERILYEDDDLVVVDKPVGVSTHAPGAGRN